MRGYTQPASGFYNGEVRVQRVYLICLYEQHGWMDGWMRRIVITNGIISTRWCRKCYKFCRWAESNQTYQRNRTECDATLNKFQMHARGIEPERTPPHAYQILTTTMKPLSFHMHPRSSQRLTKSHYYAFSPFLLASVLTGRTVPILPFTPFLP